METLTHENWLDAARKAYEDETARERQENERLEAEHRELVYRALERLGLGFVREACREEGVAVILDDLRITHSPGGRALWATRICPECGQDVRPRMQVNGLCDLYSIHLLTHTCRPQSSASAPAPTVEQRLLEALREFVTDQEGMGE